MITAATYVQGPNLSKVLLHAADVCPPHLVCTSASAVGWREWRVDFVPFERTTDFEAEARADDMRSRVADIKAESRNTP